jgi:hypothetical protein
VALPIANPAFGKLFDSLTLGILIAMAYGAWLTHGESRAFRVGFLCWAVLYFILFKKTFEIGVPELMRLAYNRALQTPTATHTWVGGSGGVGGVFVPGPYRFMNFHPVSHSLVLLLLGLIGGWVTVYFYRKRQRMISPLP